ncbi:response regulator transcription factor [Winogradskyella sp. MH6]|uniref:response regulator transcription factor n=1 Tax=Winogradskyella sp. MH6 TaxID=2929510 RepID=UPI001FB48948|nr:response regulator transcription factor [Winogradskyella sp. MH6]
MHKIRLVIVDDHKMFLDGIKTILSKENEFEIVATFNNPKDAIPFLKTNHEIDLLITDISMPEINGLEFIKIITEEASSLKILVISMFEQIQAFKGINGYLLKESGFEELKKAIKTIVINGKDYFYSNHENDKKENLEFKKSILTRREKEIIVLIAKQNSVDEIAEELFLSRHTVETHKKNIFQKLQVNNAAGLIKKAVYLGYI